jgi:adenylate kinase
MAGLDDIAVVRSIVGLPGIGKTTFITVLNEKIGKQYVPGTISIYQACKVYDTPINLFYELNKQLQSELHPAFYKVKRFR